MKAIANMAAIAFSPRQKRFRFFGCLSFDAPLLCTSDVYGRVERFQFWLSQSYGHGAPANQVNFLKV